MEIYLVSLTVGYVLYGRYVPLPQIPTNAGRISTVICVSDPHGDSKRGAYFDLSVAADWLVDLVDSDIFASMEANCPHICVAVLAGFLTGLV